MSLEFVASLDYRGFSRSLNSMKSEVAQMSRAIEVAGMNASSALERMRQAGEGVAGTLRNIGAAAGAAFSVSQAKSFFNKIAETRGYFQDIESSMRVFLGNEEKAKDFTDKLQKYAYYNMFEFSDLAQASKQMIAYGNSVDTVIPRLDQLSNVARGTSAPLMEMVGAYNRAKNIGYLDTRALQSWASKGLVIKDVLEEMGEKVKNNKVTFEQLNRVLDHVTGEGGMFHNLMGEQMSNITAEQGQLEDNLTNMYNEIGEKYQDFITGVIKAESWLVDHYEQVGAVIMSLIAAYGEYRASLIALNAVQGAKQKYLTNTEVEMLDEAIRKEKEGYEELLAVKSKAANADLAESVVKGKLTGQQAALIAAKRQELETVQIKKELLGVDERMNQLKGNKLDLDLQEKVRTEQLTLVQAEQIQQKRAQLEQMEREIGLLKEKRMLEVDKKIEGAGNEKKRTEDKIGALNASRAKNRKRVEKIDEQLSRNPNVSDKARNDALSEREAILRKIKGEEDAIAMLGETKKRSESELRDLYLEQQKIRLQFGNEDEKRDALQQMKYITQEQLTIDREAADAARRKWEEGKKGAEEALQVAEKQLNLAKRQNEMNESNGDSFQIDLAPFEEEVNKAEVALDAFTDSENANELQVQKNIAADKVKATQSQLNTIVTTEETLATTQNTASKTSNTTATNAATVSERIHAIATRAGTVATAIFSTAVQQLRVSFIQLGMAIKTNPLGILLSAVTLALPWIMSWVSGNEDAASAEEQMGNEAKEAAGKVTRQLAALDAMDKTSLQYKRTLKELASTYEEYGIEVEKTKDENGKEIVTLDALKAKHEELINVLKEEAIQKRLNANIDQAFKDYEEGIDKVKQKIVESMTNTFGANKITAIDETQAKAIIDAIPDSEIQKIGKAAQALKDAKPGEEWKKAMEEYEKTLAKAKESLSDFGKESGWSAQQQVRASTALSLYGRQFAPFVTALNQTITAQENAAKAAEQANDVQDETAKKLLYSTMNAKGFKDELEKIVRRFRDTKINVEVLYSETNVPGWMKKMGKKDIQAALSAYTQALDRAAKTGATHISVNGKAMGVEEAAKRQVQYTKQKQNIEDQETAAAAEKKRLQEEAERNADRLVREAGARRRKNAELDRKEAEERLRQYQSAQDAIIRAKIAGERNEGIRERMEREEQHRLNLQQIDDQEREYRKKNLDALKARWEANNKRKDAVYEDSQEYKDYVSGKRNIPLTDDQSKELDARRSEEAARYLEENYKALDSMTNGFMTQQQERMKQTKEYEDSIASIESAITAEKEKGANADLKAVGMLQARLDVAKALLEVSKADAQELEFLMQYGDSGTKITAIQQSYGNQIKEASARGDAFGVMNLQKQMEEAISQVNFDELKKEVNWEAIFGNLGNVTKRELEAFKKKLQDFMELPEFAKADENVRRSALEGIANVNQALIGKGGVFSSIGTARNARNKAIEDLNTAQMNEDASRATLELLRQGLKDGWATKEDVSRQSADLAKKEAVTQDKKKQRANADTTYKDTRDDAINKLNSEFDALRGAIAPVEDLFNSLGDSTVTEVFDTVGNALQSATGTFDSFNQLSGMFGKDSAIGSALGMAGPYGAAAAAAVNVATSLMPQGNMEEMNRHLEELNTRSGILASVMQDLEKTIAEGNTMEAVKARDEAEAVYLSQLALEQEKISTEMHKWERGSQSVSAMLTDDSRFKELLSQVNDFMAANGRESRANGDWELTRMAPEDLAYLRKNNTDLYTELMLRIQGAENAHTGSGIADMFGDYIDNFAGKLEELDKALAESLTGITFDSVEDSFMGFLDNITGATDDGAQYIEKTLRNALIKSLVGNEYRKRLEEWYKKVAEAQERGTLAQETRALKDEYMAILKDAEKVQESIDKTIGYQPDAQSQSGINKSVSSMSQEVGNELNGRFTAIQISNENINRQMAAAVLQLSSMTGLLTGSQGGVLTDIREQMVTGNGFLADIVAWNKKMYDDFTSRMDAIATNTSRL